MVCATRKGAVFPPSIAMTPEGSPASKSNCAQHHLNQVIRFEILNAKHSEMSGLPTINTASATRIPIRPPVNRTSHLTTTVWWCADLTHHLWVKTFTQQTRWRSGGVKNVMAILNNPAAAGPNTIPTTLCCTSYAPTRWSGQCWLTDKTPRAFNVSGRLKQIQFEGLWIFRRRNSRAANHQYMVPQPDSTRTRQ